ncbi:hypothetical protein MTQ10_12560 [Streptomyces sp. XM83C]|uniref:S1 motif domain-containing protein n=1 Tax=Streptomyces thermocoprophilus TaxID=78356 RepID=A0ABV5VDW6_9ACTN|nr:hypothetical protein [Streptomyces sp. XM83C]MCK1820422.1 hypothetical protein [Streptomyces sp. XM83C]
MTLDLRRRGAIEEDLVFFAMPYEEKELPNGRVENFDDLYEGHFEFWMKSWELRAERADKVPGTTESALDVAWSGIDRAGIVVVDLSVPSTSVAMELAWAMCLRKRLIVIAHRGAVVPSNALGQFRVVWYEWSVRGLADLRTSLRAEIDALRQQRREPEMDLRPYMPEDRLRATVKIEEVHEEYIRVRDLNHPRRCAEMYKSDMSYREAIPDHMSQRFHVGRTIPGFFVYRDNALVFTQQEGPDPWDDWERTYLRGQTLTARVYDVNQGGVWVELEGGGRSRVPTHQAAGLKTGDELSVVIKWLDRGRQKIDISLADESATVPAQAAAPVPPPALDDYPKAGERQGATVIVPSDSFVLVRLDDYPELPTLALLHARRMSASLRDDLEAGRVTEGRRVLVDVEEVGPSRSRPGRIDIKVREIEGELPPQTEAAQDVSA